RGHRLQRNRLRATSSIAPAGKALDSRTAGGEKRLNPRISRQEKRAMEDTPAPPPAPDLDPAVPTVPGAAELRPEDKAFLQEHALKKPLRVLDIWALGVGVAITGIYFGWNLGLRDNGPVAMLVASLLVCLLYLTWVLALAELSVAMPFAGGPLAYGRRAFSPSLG